MELQHSTTSLNTKQKNLKQNNTAYKADMEKLESEIKVLEQQMSETNHQNGQLEQLQERHRVLTTEIRDMSNKVNLQFDGNSVDPQGTLPGGSVSNDVLFLDGAGQHNIIKKQIIAKQKELNQLTIQMVSNFFSSNFVEC